MDELTILVLSAPPAKNEARSMFAPGHPHADDVRRLLSAAQRAAPEGGSVPFGREPIALEVRVRSRHRPRTDATNILGGIADVLEVKSHRGSLDHLGELADVALYENDRQIELVTYSWDATDDDQASYEVTVRRRTA